MGVGVCCVYISIEIDQERKGDKEREERGEIERESVCVYTYIHTYAHTCMHTYMHACMQGIHTHIPPDAEEGTRRAAQFWKTMRQGPSGNGYDNAALWALVRRLQKVTHRYQRRHRHRTEIPAWTHAHRIRCRDVSVCPLSLSLSLSLSPSLPPSLPLLSARGAV